MPEFAVGIKFECVVHEEAPNQDVAKAQAKSDKEYLSMLLEKGELEVTFCEEQ